VSVETFAGSTPENTSFYIAVLCSEGPDGGWRFADLERSGSR
jgi:hypothetical protein